MQCNALLKKYKFNLYYTKLQADKTVTNITALGLQVC